jgi:anti-anti-sigma factor
MEITDKLFDGIRVIYISGNIILEETNQMKDYIEKYIEDPDLKGIIINCRNIDYIDSSGLGLIVSVYKTLKKSDKYFALSSLDAKTMEIFVLTRLNEILVIADSDEAALNSFKS